MSGEFGGFRAGATIFTRDGMRLEEMQMDLKEYGRKITEVEEMREQAENNRKNSSTFRPQHYAQYTIEPWTFIMVNNIPFPEGNVIKYVCRWRQKNGIEDLKKARRILDMMIELEENRDKYIPEKGCL